MDYFNVPNFKDYSAMMQNFIETKRKYIDCFLFYRLGDFYELFFDDAEKASEILDLVLTGRDCGKNVNRAPMCGIPFHSADTYISKLVSKGYKVAICEQLEDPSEVVGSRPVERGVIRVITAGTVTEEEFIDEKQNNFICSVYLSKEKCAIAWCDITTGQFFVRQCNTESFATELADNLVRIAPAEIIANSKAENFLKDMPIVKHEVIPKPNAYSDFAFAAHSALSVLKEHFGVNSLAVFGVDTDEMVSACGAIISYLKETQMNSLQNINKILIENSSDYLTLDANAIKNLEIVKTMADNKKYGSLLWLMDKTSTVMGARNLRSWLLSPITDKEKINYRLDGVEELYNNAFLSGGIADNLKNIRDIERLSGKISNGTITPYDCKMLAESLSVLPTLKMMLFGVQSKILNDVNEHITDFTELTKILDLAIEKDRTPTHTRDGGYIASGFDPELDRLRNIKQTAASTIEKMQADEREKTGIKNLKIGFNRVFGYYIEVTNSFKDIVPYNYIRKQTLAGAERYMTEELKILEEEILGSEEKAKKLEAEIFAKIKALLSDSIKKIQNSSRSIACLDTLLSFASVAKKNNYVRPTIVDSDMPLNVVGGRHPVVEYVSNERFVSNDIILDNEENRVMIITGPNMAGKSTYMRQNALIVLMAHTGSFVPAKSAEIPITDRIFTRVGASDNLVFDQSTFMVEMTEVASILVHATPKSLLILDEVGRGTSTYDGLSIAWAVVEYLALKIKAKTLFATHYHELSELEGVIDGIKNYKITVKESDGSIIFLRQIVRGSANRSFGIEVASLAGIPKDVTAKAKQILKSLEKNDLTKKMGEPIETIEENLAEEDSMTALKDAIRDIDINSTTPFEALKILSKLKGMID